ncbi:MAG: hypothetical protein ABR501_10245 [Pyrinomonadaceae bacterium]
MPFGNMKFKLYSASLGAAKITDAIGDDPSNVDWVHISAIFTAPDMESAQRSCEIVAFNSWPPDEGWSNHSAAVTEVTDSFIREVLVLQQSGSLDETPAESPAESHQFFHLEPPDTTTH